MEVFEYESVGSIKSAYVYLPYGYEEDESIRYNILYFMHGGGGNAGQFYNRSYALNDILDHAIENGEIDPLIVVTPTFYLPQDTDTGVSNAGQRVSVFHQEFIQDLMPAVERRYRTYAESTDQAGLEASRNHRAFGGFSMTGSDDIAYDAMHSQLEAMRETGGFTFGASSEEGNISFQILDGATHDYTYYRNYIYTILPYSFEE